MKLTRTVSRAAALFAWVLAMTLAAQAPAQRPAQPPRSFDGAEAWAMIFDDPARELWQMPAQVIRALSLAPNASVADIGSGTGYFAVRLARAVPKGRVFGVDVEPDMVRYLAQRAEKEGLANLVSVAGTPGDPQLPAAVDAMIMVDVYHHISDRIRYLRNLQRYLKPGGRVAVIDHLDAPGGMAKSMLIDPTRVKREFKGAGYRVVAEHRFLPTQYFLVFKGGAR